RFEVQERAVIGRNPLSEVCLADSMVSLCHAEVVRAPDGKYRVRDLGSRHGTFLGSKKVAEAALADGGGLMGGAGRLRFEDRPAPTDADRDVERLRAVVELTRAIGVEHDLERLCERILDTAFQLLRADRGAVLLHGGDGRPQRVVARYRSGGRADVVFS